MTTLLHHGELYRGENLTAMDCRKCGFVHLSPLPSAEDIARRYSTDQFYGKDKPNYRANEERDKEWLEQVCYPTQMALIKDALRSGGETLLDVGAGYGHFINWAVGRGWSCKGIEPAPIVSSDAAWAHRSIETAEINHEYDVVRAAWVLEHLHDPMAALKKIHGWVKAGGVLLAIVPNDFSIIQQAVVAADLAKPHYWLSDQHVNYFTPNSLAVLLERTGFEVVSQYATYPMEKFLFEGYQYLGSDAVGADCHRYRKRMELNLVKSDAGRETLMRMGLLYAQAGIGRDIIIAARKR